MKGWQTFRAIVSWVAMTIGGMWGGQKNKGTRRFGIPGLAVIFAAFHDGFQWKDMVFLLLIPVLVVGYGENSWIMNIVGADWAARLVYAALLSIPFAFYGRVRWIISLAALCLAFSIRAGSIGHVGWFGDILVEDIFRYGVLSALVVFNITKKPSSCRN